MGFALDLTDLFDLGLGLGVVVLDFEGVCDRSFDGVLGVRGVLGVGGSLLMKWHGRVTFFWLSAGDC